MNPDPQTIGNHLYVAVLLPFDRQMKVDEAAYRSFLQHFLKNEKIRPRGQPTECMTFKPGALFPPKRPATPPRGPTCRCDR